MGRRCRRRIWRCCFSRWTRGAPADPRWGELSPDERFYAKLGFEKIGGQEDQNWLILRNGNATIGLFQGMFEHNILTFNPGWDAHGNKLGEFTDVRELQRRVRSHGVEPVNEADEATTGPASFEVVDPDGNRILIDQHV